MTTLYHVKNGHLAPDTRTRLFNENQLQAWIAENPRLIGLEILVLGREVSTDFGGRIDILGLDRDGNPVVIECKRDRTPRDIIAQVLDYASCIAKPSGARTRRIRPVHQNEMSRIFRRGSNTTRENDETRGNHHRHRQDRGSATTQ
jgi:RecB family endonuclease NucS